MSSQFVMTYPAKRPKRAFITLKQYTLNYSKLAARIKLIEDHLQRQFKDVYEVLNYLMEKDKIDSDQKNRKRIGY